MQLAIMRLQKVLNGTHDGKWQFRAVFNETRFSKKIPSVVSNGELNAFHATLSCWFQL